MENSLIVAEVFYSLQGEGQTMGIPAVFLRLAGCNLLCEGAGWRCDTIEVWQKGRNIKFEDVLLPAHIDRLKQKDTHLIITGGEPMLHQHRIMDYLRWFERTYNFLPIIEIETNGTIIPDSNLFRFITYWNVSPKLSTTGEPYEKRFNDLAWHKIAACAQFDKVIFKFVISSEADVVEVLQDFHSLPFSKVMFMPAGATQEELARTRPMVAENCKNLSIRYCDRLHVVLWNKKTGV